MKNLLLFFLFLIFTLFTHIYAHQPIWNESSPDFDSSFQVEEIRISKAIFGDLNAGEVDVYRLDVPAGFQLNISLFKGNCKDFDPKLWLATEGEGESDTAEYSGLDNLDTPDGYVLTRLEPKEWRKYSGHGLKGYKGIEVSEFLNGMVYLIVEAGEESGPTLLSLAGLEEWGGSDEGRAAMPRFNRCEMK